MQYSVSANPQLLFKIKSKYIKMVRFIVQIFATPLLVLEGGDGNSCSLVSGAKGVDRIREGRGWG